MGSLDRDGFRFDTGPSWYLMPEVFDHFFQMMGTSTADQLELRTLDPGYQVFSEPEEGKPSSAPLKIPHGAHRVEEVFEALEPGSGPALATYLHSARTTAQMAERFFLYNPFTRIRSLAHRHVIGSLPTLATLLATPLDSFVSRRFTHPVLRQVLGYPAVFLGTSPAAAPAMYHLMSSFDLDDGVRYPMGGFSRIISSLTALAVAAGVTVITGAQVTQITTGKGGTATPRGSRKRAVTGVQWRDKDAREHITHADIVVSGADLHHTETALLRDEDRSYPERWWRKRTSGPGAVLVFLGIRGKLPELAHHSLLFTRDWDKNFASIFGAEPKIQDPTSIYVCMPSATDPSVSPADHENLFVLVPIPADPAIGSGGPDGSGDQAVEQIADAAIDQIAAWANIPDLRERIVVRQTTGPRDFELNYHSWRGGMLGPAHTLRQSAMFRPQNASMRVTGLFYAGATTAPGVGVPMCLISAELVVKRIRGDHSPGPLAPSTPREAR